MIAVKTYSHSGVWTRLKVSLHSLGDWNVDCPPATAPSAVLPLADRLRLLEADVARGRGGGGFANPVLWRLHYLLADELALRFSRLRALPAAAARARAVRLVVVGPGAVVGGAACGRPSGGRGGRW